MIYDGLEHIGLYKGLYLGLDALIGWLEGKSLAELAELPLGRTEILGERLFANVMEVSTRAPEDACYEWHRKYMDVQLDLVGAERVRTSPGGMAALGEFDESVDAGLGQAAEGNSNILEATLGNGRFALFVVGEPHMPTLSLVGEGPAPVKKVVFKVLADAYWDV